MAATPWHGYRPVTAAGPVIDRRTFVRAGMLAAAGWPMVATSARAVPAHRPAHRGAEPRRCRRFCRAMRDLGVRRGQDRSPSSVARPMGITRSCPRSQRSSCRAQAATVHRVDRDPGVDRGEGRDGDGPGGDRRGERSRRRRASWATSRGPAATSRERPCTCTMRSASRSSSCARSCRGSAAWRALESRQCRLPAAVVGRGARSRLRECASSRSPSACVRARTLERTFAALAVRARRTRVLVLAGSLHVAAPGAHRRVRDRSVVCLPSRLSVHSTEAEHPRELRTRSAGDAQARERLRPEDPEGRQAVGACRSSYRPSSSSSSTQGRRGDRSCDLSVSPGTRGRRHSLAVRQSGERYRLRRGGRRFAPPLRASPGIRSST